VGAQKKKRGVPEGERTSSRGTEVHFPLVENLAGRKKKKIKAVKKVSFTGGKSA